MTLSFLQIAASMAVMTVVSGCAGLSTISAATRPNDLYALTPKSTFDPNLPRLRSQILVEIPTATATVDTDRIAVQPNPYQVEYLGRARWVERAPLIVQALLIESYENSGKVGAVGRSAVGINPDFVIVSDLREFQAFVPEIDAPDAPLEVVVRVNIKIVDNFEDRIVGSSSFEAMSPAATDDPLDLAKAFDEALGRTMRKCVEWSIRTMAAQAQG